jgi:hypothetical protein
MDVRHRRLVQPVFLNLIPNIQIVPVERSMKAAMAAECPHVNFCMFCKPVNTSRLFKNTGLDMPHCFDHGESLQSFLTRFQILVHIHVLRSLVAPSNVRFCKLCRRSCAPYAHLIYVLSHQDCEGVLNVLKSLAMNALSCCFSCFCKLKSACTLIIK